MRAKIILISSLLSFASSYGQIYEVGAYLGGSNFIGDVGATNYISPNQLAFGGLIKWNQSPRHSFRASLIYTTLDINDSKSDDPRRKMRGYKFKTDLLEISAGMEFTFFDFNLHEGDDLYTPYLYTGISIAYHDNFYFKNGVLTPENTSSWAYGIPMVLGFKMTMTDHLILAAEVGARYTFSDEIDGSVPDAKERRPQFSFGNINNNDWYMFSGLTLTYTFGRNPCYCVY